MSATGNHAFPHLPPADAPEPTIGDRCEGVEPISDEALALLREKFALYRQADARANADPDDSIAEDAADDLENELSERWVLHGDALMARLDVAESRLSHSLAAEKSLTEALRDAEPRALPEGYELATDLPMGDGSVPEGWRLCWLVPVDDSEEGR